MTAPDATDIAAFQERYPEVFRSNWLRRYSGLIGVAACALYTLYCWWFFSIGAVVSSANWGVASIYLADWISYDVRPSIEISENYLEVKYSKFSVLGPNPDPDWLVKESATVDKATRVEAATRTNSRKSSSSSFVAPSMANVNDKPAGEAATPADAAAGQGEPATVRSLETVRADVDMGDGRIEVTPTQVSVTHRGRTLVFDIVRKKSVNARQDLPEWAEQRSAGSTVYLSFGWSGRAEIQDDEVVVWKRFLGWENFVFDTTSKFWGRPFGEVVSLIFSGERLDPAMSNAALAMHDFWNNLEWQHGDVWTKLLQTIVMAFVGTLLASVVAFPLAFVAARNVTANRPLNQIAKRFFDFQRSVDMLIWALFFTRAFGPGPLAGISAIFFTDTGTLGKLYSEALENVDDKQREGIKSVGAHPALAQRYGVLPQVLPVFASQALYFWESNTRSATIIGAVGAGGIGLKLWEAMRTNQDWENVGYMVLLILIVVFVFDHVSNFLRSRLIGSGH